MPIVRASGKMWDDHEVVIERAISVESLREVYELRYLIYIEQMKREQKYADHAARQIKEPMDEDGVIFVARKAGRVVGTVRGNRASDQSAAYYRSFYRIELFGDTDPNCIQITTKLMVLPELRSSGIPMQLLLRYTQNALKNGIRLDVMDCNDYLIPLFEHFGFLSYMGWAEHAEYGRVRPMFLAPDAHAHLRNVGSALAKMAQTHTVDGQYGGYDLIRRLALRPITDRSLKSWMSIVGAERAS